MLEQRPWQSHYGPLGKSHASNLAQYRVPGFAGLSPTYSAKDLVLEDGSSMTQGSRVAASAHSRMAGQRQTASR